MLVDTWRTSDLDETMALMAERDGDYRYTVAWIDALSNGPRLGRGVITMAEHAPAGAVNASDPLHFDDRPLATMPPLFPSGLLSRLSISAFNELWYRKAPKERRNEVQGISAFFHPLDMVGEWNRLYGPRGMLQYQFVVPAGQEATMRYAIERLAAGGAASFLTVLKRFGPGNAGPLSFPYPGWTLTLDVPTGITGLADLLDELDRRLVDVGGRVYFAKDSRVSAALIPKMYPRLPEWRAVCDRLDPKGIMQSDLSRRLGLRVAAHSAGTEGPR
jgi:decaprenylphospho-beta-D-ribofuranose 2-oxidase